MGQGVSSNKGKVKRIGLWEGGKSIVGVLLHTVFICWNRSTKMIEDHWAKA